MQSPNNTGAVVTPAFTATETRVQFRVVRPGSQRIGTTQMSSNVGEGGLYFMDVEVVSEGTGDLFNLPQGAALRAEGYAAEGYELTTRTPELGFSTEEDLGVRISRVVHAVGTNDDPEEASPVTGKGLSIEAEGSDLVAQTQVLLTTDATRDICANPLARALYPHFVYLDVRYTGGPQPAELESFISSQLAAWPPDEPFEASWVIEKVRQMGATSVQSPLTLCVVVYLPDRTVKLVRSQDQVNIGGLAAFYPGSLRFTRSTI